MPEEGLETAELREKLEETAEHAHGEHGGGEGEHKPAAWILWLSLSTAIIAVLAAIASLESGDHANEAIVVKTDATLTQSKADDTWAYFQAKSIKTDLYETQSAMATKPEQAEEWKKKAAEEKAEKEKLKKEAEALEDEVKKANEEAAHHLHVHHQFAKSVTIFQVAIALAAIAALTRRKLMWWVSLAVGAAGAAFFVMGFLH